MKRTYQRHNRTHTRHDRTELRKYWKLGSFDTSFSDVAILSQSEHRQQRTCSDTCSDTNSDMIVLHGTPVETCMDQYIHCHW